MRGRKTVLPIIVIFLLLSLLAAAAVPIVVAQTGDKADVEAPDSFADGSLPATLKGVTSYSFDKAVSEETLQISISNPTGTNLSLYLAIYRDDQWNIVKRIGYLDPGKSQTFDVPVTFSYNGRPSETDQFGVVAKTSSGFIGQKFQVAEDWSVYEDQLRSLLSVVGGLIAVLMVVTLVIVLAGVIGVAAGTRHKEVAGKGEYTLWTLFFPLMKTRPLGEKIANVVINPVFWVIEAVCGALLVLIILLSALSLIPSDIGVMVFLIGGVAALFMPAMFLVLSWITDWFEREPFRFLIAMFMWGVLSTFFAFFLNTFMDIFLSAVLLGLSWFVVAVFVAPFVEETVKGFGLLLVSGHHELDDTFDGMLYGFAIGMGFAAVENWLYFAANASPVSVGGLGPWTFNIAYRSILCALGHGVFTGATGAVIGFMKSRKSLRSWAFLGYFLGVPIAIFLHSTFNFFASIDIETAMGIPLPVFDPVLTVAMVVLYCVIGTILQYGIYSRQKNAKEEPKV